MRRHGRRQSRGLQAGSIGRLTGAVRALAFSMFESDSYNIDGGTSKIGSWVEKSTHASGVGPGHLMSQAVSAQQCAVPTADALFLGRVSGTFVDQRYSSSAAASAWRFLHDGTGCAVYSVVSFTTLSGAKYLLATSSGGASVGWNMGTSATALASATLNVGAVIGAPSGGVLAASSATYVRHRYEEGASPEIDVYIKTASAGTVASTSAAPAVGVDPTGTLMLGNRQAVNAPFIGQWLSTIIIKGAYSATTDTVVKAYIAAKYGVT